MVPKPQQTPGQIPDFRVTPLIPPPPGVSSQFENPVSRAPMAIAVAAVMLLISTTFIGGRLYARKVVLNAVGLDDWVGLAGWVFVAEYTIYAIVLLSQAGMGPHMWDIPGNVFLDKRFGLRMLFTEIMYCPSAYLVKLSIFLLYKRIFVVPGSRTRKFIMGGLYASSALYLVLTILSFAFCTKSSSLVDGGDCHTKSTVYVSWALAVVNILTDAYLLAIPPFVLSKLHISAQRKWAVLAAFFFLLTATSSSIISVYYRVYVSRNTLDFSWNVVPAAIATICELNLGVVCSSLPAMNVLLRRRFQKQNAGTVSGTNNRTRWFFNYLMSCISNRLHDQSILLANSNISQSINVSGEPDIMKLTDIVQHSEPIGEGNASMGSSPNRSLAPSTHKVDT